MADAAVAVAIVTYTGEQGLITAGLSDAPNAHSLKSHGPTIARRWHSEGPAGQDCVFVHIVIYFTL